MRAKWILLVEDDRDHEALALRALRKANVPAEVVVARSGAQALECVLAGTGDGRETTPRVTLLDLKLPGMDGLEVLRRLRADNRTAGLPVVVLTSSDEQCDVNASYDLGANSYVVKPVDYDRFVEVIRQIGAYWLTLNQITGG
jgi:CheY-like chemotaxis protein